MLYHGFMKSHESLTMESLILCPGGWCSCPHASNRTLKPLPMKDGESKALSAPCCHTTPGKDLAVVNLTYPLILNGTGKVQNCTTLWIKMCAKQLNVTISVWFHCASWLWDADFLPDLGIFCLINKFSNTQMSRNAIADSPDHWCTSVIWILVLVLLTAVVLI